MLYFQLASDIHLEYFPQDKNNFSDVIVPKKDSILILAGDIGTLKNKNLDKFLFWAKPKWKKIIYVAGNHDYDGHDYETSLDNLKKICKKNGIIFLENETYKIENVVILGTTYWSKIDSQDKNIFTDRMFEYRNNLGLSIEKTNQLHENAKNWLRNQLETLDPNVKKIVVTHHPPTYNSTIAAKFEESEINQAYVSETIEEFPNVDVWCCGHTHHNFDLKVNNTRIISNQRGFKGKFEYSLQKMFKISNFEE